MDDRGGPYRQGPQWRLCPRCEEILEESFPGSLVCPRCAGSWISQVVLDAAFGDPQWPSGAAMWWRRELSCPECANAGKQTTMDAIESHGVLIDRCAGHGIWFDAGELERVINVTTDPMSALRERVVMSREEVEDGRRRYDQRREQLRAERTMFREEAARAEERTQMQELEARRAQSELTAAIGALPVPTRPELTAIKVMRRDYLKAIAAKAADLLAATRQVARIEADLASLRERFKELSESR